MPEIRSGLHTLWKGYLEKDEIANALALVDAPPAPGSAAEALDQATAKATFALQGSARWTLAAKDADMHFPDVAATFSCALGVPINETETPRLLMLMRRSLTDLGLSTYPAKNKYQRQRPFMVNGQPICTPKDEQELRSDGSYPSGHSAVGWGWGLILSTIAPERSDELIARGRAYGESRSVCNVHWLSDIKAGRPPRRHGCTPTRYSGPTCTQPARKCKPSGPCKPSPMEIAPSSAKPSSVRAMPPTKASESPPPPADPSSAC